MKRLWILVLVMACGDTTGPVVEDECQSAGDVVSVMVNGVEVDSSLIERFEICDIKHTTLQLPMEVADSLFSSDVIR